MLLPPQNLLRILCKLLIGRLPCPNLGLSPVQHATTALGPYIACQNQPPVAPYFLGGSPLGCVCTGRTTVCGGSQQPHPYSLLDVRVLRLKFRPQAYPGDGGQKSDPKVRSRERFGGPEVGGRGRPRHEMGEGQASGSTGEPSSRPNTIVTSSLRGKVVMFCLKVEVHKRLCSVRLAG